MRILKLLTKKPWLLTLWASFKALGTVFYPHSGGPLGTFLVKTPFRILSWVTGQLHTPYQTSAIP